MAIGNETDAREALIGNLPMIGEGYYREVYRKGDIVYKVMIPPVLVEEGDQNIEEYHNITGIDRDSLPDWLMIPDVSLYDFDGDTVIAMPYYEGEAVGECYCVDSEPCDDKCLPMGIVKQINLATGIIDLGYENVRRLENGTYVILDCNL